jgi:DNA-binding transcriptional MerR regulator
MEDMPMMTVHEVSKLAGVSIRTLQYYDKIGLLHPTGYTDAGYRLYDDTDLERLQHILLFRELEFPLKDIKAIINSPDFDRGKALEQQIRLLKLKKEHIENLMNFALGIKMLGVRHMDFKVFDRSKLDEYSKQAKELYGNTPEYKKLQEKTKNRTKEEDNLLADRFMLLFREAGEIRNTDPASPEAQSIVRRIQDFITENLYTCSDKILSGLGKMYSGGGDFTKNIDEYGGEGTAEFVDKAIQIYCEKNEEVE